MSSANLTGSYISSSSAPTLSDTDDVRAAAAAAMTNGDGQVAVGRAVVLGEQHGHGAVGLGPLGHVERGRVQLGHRRVRLGTEAEVEAHDQHGPTLAGDGDVVQRPWAGIDGRSSFAAWPPTTNATLDPGGGTPWCTRCTSAASPTGTVTAPAIWPGCAAASATSGTSASTPSGSTPGTGRRCTTAATTSPTTAPSTPATGRSTRPRRSSPRPTRTACESWATWCPTTRPATTCGSRRRWPPDRAVGPGSATGSDPDGAPTGPSPRTTGGPTSAGPPGSGSRTASGTCTCSTPVSPT